MKESLSNVDCSSDSPPLPQSLRSCEFRYPERSILLISNLSDLSLSFLSDLQLAVAPNTLALV